MYFVASLPKIDYKVREVAHSFLVDFIKYELTKTNDTDTFRESNRYYQEYDKDVTAQSIYANYYHVIVPAVASYDDVGALINYVENYIEFNYFDTNMSEQGEKLYLYMNSRGESLSTQERIKSVIIGRSTDKLLAGRMWEDWQNFFWRVKPQADKNADRGFSEFLKWAVIIHMCVYQDTIIKKTANADTPKSRIEEIEDYIRIEKEVSVRLQQTDWICTYISTNENFTYEWLQRVESAVEYLYALLQMPDFKEWDFNVNPWFSGCEDTIEYSTLLGLLYYIISFSEADKNETNILRMGMYLKNLKSEYTLRRNPDRTVIRCIGLVEWMARKKIKDTRLLGKYALGNKESMNDRYVLRTDDLRWGYYQLDWQNAQSVHVQPDKVGQWERFFWKITNNRGLNHFLRGNHDFVIRVLCKVQLCPDTLLALFVEKIYNCRNSNALRANLLEYGDISVSDNGGSNNIGPNWMERWCLLASDRDEKYWNEFMNGEEAEAHAIIIANYLEGNTSNRVSDPILEELAKGLTYMKQTFYLWDSGQRLRIVLLEAKLASKAKARELCVQFLHRCIPESWVWDHNFCVVNFVPTLYGLDTSVEDKNTGYYLDLWYDWDASGGRWYCRIGHKEHDLSGELIRSIQEKSNERLGIKCDWQIETSGRMALRTGVPIYTETLKEEYFKGALFVKSFYDRIWSLLIDLYGNGILV